MKDKLITVGSYLLAGTISCIALAGVAGNKEKAVLPPDVPHEAEAAPVAASASLPSVAEEQAKPKRSRKSSAKKAARSENVEKSSTPRKPRAKKGRKAASGQATAQQE